MRRAIAMRRTERAPRVGGSVDGVPYDVVEYELPAECSRALGMGVSGGRLWAPPADGQYFAIVDGVDGGGAHVVVAMVAAKHLDPALDVIPAAPDDVELVGVVDGRRIERGRFWHRGDLVPAFRVLGRDGAVLGVFPGDVRVGDLVEIRDGNPGAGFRYRVEEITIGYVGGGAVAPVGVGAVYGGERIEHLRTVKRAPACFRPAFERDVDPGDAVVEALERIPGVDVVRCGAADGARRCDRPVGHSGRCSSAGIPFQLAAFERDGDPGDETPAR